MGLRNSLPTVCIDIKDKPETRTLFSCSVKKFTFNKILSYVSDFE